MSSLRSASPALAAALLFGASTPLAKLLVGEVPPLMLVSTVSYRDGNLGLFDQDTRWTDGLFHQAS
jgi:hypothetical protein